MTLHPKKLKSKDQRLEFLKKNTTGMTPKTKRLHVEMGCTVLHKRLEDIVVEEIEVPAHDGEKVPLTIMHNGTVNKEGNTALIDYGLWKLWRFWRYIFIAI